jgi:hypothetical protein
MKFRMMGLVFASALLTSGQTSAPEKPATVTVQKPLQQQVKDALRARKACEEKLAEWDKWRTNNWNDERQMTVTEAEKVDEIETLTKQLEKYESASASEAREASVTFDATTLKLGMPKAAVLSALGLKYDVKPVSPPNLPSSPNAYAILNRSTTIGFVRFDDQGVLVAAERNWMPEPRQYAEEEIGRTLVALIGSLADGGQKTCTIEASFTSANGDAAVAWREASIKCAGKRLLIQVLTPPSGRGELNVVEQIEGK